MIQTLDLQTVKIDHDLVVHIAGEMDVRTANRLRECFLEAATSGVVRVVLDMTELDFIDSSGFGVLLGGQRRMRARGGHVALRGVRPSVRKALELTSLDEVFELEE